METWVVGLLTLAATIVINIMIVAFKSGRHTKELESLREVMNLRLEFIQNNHEEIKHTLSEVRTTTLRLGNELSKLLGQLENDNGQN